MKKYKIYTGESVDIFYHGEIEAGYEADAVLDVLSGAFLGAKTFASHLKEPKKFWDQFKRYVEELVETTEKEINRLGSIDYE